MAMNIAAKNNELIMPLATFPCSPVFTLRNRAFVALLMRPAEAERNERVLGIAFPIAINAMGDQFALTSLRFTHD